MVDDESKTADNVEITKETVANQPERFDFEVLSEEGLFKNGQQYNKGDIVQLDEKTAFNFLNPEVHGKDFDPPIKRVGK